MEMVAHQAVRIQLKRLALSQVEQGIEKCLVISLAEEYLLAVVATVHHVVHEAGSDRTKRSRHVAKLARRTA